MTNSRQDGAGYEKYSRDFRVSWCHHCGSLTIWQFNSIIYPLFMGAEPANKDLPPDILADYEEARTIVQLSPRGAAALLRLCIEKLCKHLGLPGKDINSDIKALVKQGLPTKISQSLDAVRVIGNCAVHPGVIDLRDDPNTASALFKLVNIIAEKLISEPAEVDAIYDGLPESAKQAIVRRDTPPPKP